MAKQFRRDKRKNLQVLMNWLLADSVLCLLGLIASKTNNFHPKVCTNEILFVPLHHENPPSLSTMLKCAGRFFIR
ncbi:MAG: hypothetical protein KBT12_00660, partial [Bacteroidales bacterium]|nr:hypothetical protein [Candidatus Physcousia equi]